MKLLLYSDYWCMPNKDVLSMLSNKGGTCLFCDYADRRAFKYIASVKAHLSEVFDKIIDLSADFKFDEKIDCIFVNGGNNFELTYKLHKHGQFEKIKEMILSGVLYIGNSAGSVLLGDDFMFSAQYEPPERNLDKDFFCKGFGLIHKNIVVHASKYKLSDTNGLYFNKASWQTYLKYKKDIPNSIKIGNNEVFVVDGDVQKTKRYSFKKLAEKIAEK